MQGAFKVKTKLSWSPGKAKEVVYVVRARQGNKIDAKPQAEPQQNNCELRRPNSRSLHKMKAGISRMFKKAHLIESTETYLVCDHKQRESLTKGSSTPATPTSLRQPGSRIPKPLTSPGRLADRAKSGIKGFSSKKQSKNIQRTVSIAYRGSIQNIPVEAKLMTTLSRLILGDQKSQDDFYLEVLGQSSIVGDEDNFIDFGQSDIMRDIDALDLLDLLDPKPK